MSCSKCGSVNTGCGCKDTAYTTPKVYTCPPDTSCPQPVRCSEFMDAACIFLNDGIADAGIQPGSSLESIVQQLILLVTNPGCVDAPGGVPGGGTVTFIDAVWPGNAITIAGGPISNSGTFVFNGNGTSNQYIDGQGNLQNFPAISGPVEFQTNGTPNSVQDLLNLVAGNGVTLTESGGSVTIDVDAVAYTVDNGLSADPTDPNNFQLGSETSPGAPLIHDTYIAGAQFRFEINNTNSMFLQGNRVDIEGGASGAMMLSTGGASDNSVEVDGTEVAIESVGGGATRIFLDPAKIKIQTPLFNTKANNDVLTLIDSATGEVEFMPPAGILLQTDGVDNADQTYLNLIPGNGIVLTNTAGDVTIDGPTFQTDGTDNSTQTLLNLVAGTGITLSESGGSVTIEAAAPSISLTTNLTGGASTYNTGTGALNIPIYQSQIDVQDEGVSRVINPTIMNFVGGGVTVTNSGSEAIITIPGGGGGSADANNGLILNIADYPTPTVQLGGPDTAPAPLVRNTYITTAGPLGEYDFDIAGVRATKPIINVTNTGQGTAIKGVAAGGYAIYGVSASGFSGYFEAQSGLIGLYSVNKTGNLAAQLESISSINNTVIPVLRVTRTVDTANPAINGANGIGAAVDFVLEDNNNIAANAGAISYEFTSAATGAVVSKFAVTTANSSTISRKLEITGAGQLILNNYTTATSFDPESGASVGVLNVDNTGKVFVGAGGGGPSLAVEVDGTPLSSSTLLNFVPSSDIAFTDLGGGQLSLSLVNPPVTYDSNEGVYKDTSLANDTFQLGSPGVGGSTISVPRFITTATTGTLNIIGSFYSPTAKGILHVENDSVAAGTGEQTSISGWSTGRGVYGYSSGSYVFSTGVFGSADNGYGVYANSTNGVALKAVSQNSTALNITRSSLAAQDATVAEMAYYYRGASAGATGVGGGMKFVYDIAGGPSVFQSHEIVHKFTNVGVATQLSQYEIWGNNLGSLQQQFTILGGGTSGPAGAWTLAGGQIKFNRYAGGAIYKSANDLSTNSGYNLGIDANGNIWATDFSTSTGPVTGVSNISIGTLTNGASATVNNPSGPSATIDITGQNAYTQIQADSGTAQNATVFNEAFKITGAQGITTSIASPSSLDTVTVNGPVKYLNFQLKDSGNNNITGGLYTPAAWDSTLNIRAGAGIALSNDTANANTLIIGTTGGGPTGGTVLNVSGTDANGFTFNITNPSTTPNITLGTNLTGILVGNGTGMTAIAPPTGSGVLTYNSTTNSYSYTTLPTVNDGQLLLSSNTAGATNTSIGIAYTTAGNPPTSTGPFTANKATNSNLQLSIGPALANLVTVMTGGVPTTPATGPNTFENSPRYIAKSAQDSYQFYTPVTTFSPGTTGFNITNAVTSPATSSALNGAVVLGGVLNVANGGTGSSTAPTAGQILIGNSTGGYSVATITGSGGTSVTVGDGTINISSSLGNVTAKSGTYVNADGSVRLGSGAQTTDPPAALAPSPLLERAIVRLDSWLFRLADGADGVVNDLGFDVSDLANVKRGYLGTPTRGFWFSSSASGAAAPTSAFQGFVYGGQTSNAFPTNMSGFLFTPSGSAAFPATFSGVGVDTGNARVVTGYLGNSVYEVISRTGNIISQHGLWGGQGGAADFLMYQANATSKLISIGDVSLLGNSTRFQVDDANLRYNFRKGNIYAFDYGSGTPVGLDANSTARYTLATASNGKFYEIPAISIGSIVVTGSTPYTPSTLATTGAPNALTVAGTGTVGVTLSGSTLTINGTGVPAFPYWSTIAFTKAGTGTLTNNGTTVTSASIVPDVIGANQLNIQAGNNIGINVIDATTNRIEISAIVPPAGVSFGTANLTASGTGTATGQTNITAATPSGIIGLIAGNGISFAGSSTAGTITISSIAGLTSIVGSTNGSVSVNVNASGVATVTGPSIWNTIAVSTPGGTLGPQTSLTPDTVFDTLNFAAGPGITISTSAVGNADTITISNIGAVVNAWHTIAVANGSAAGGTTSLTPNLNQDTLTIAGGTGISVSTNPTGFSDRVVVTNTGVTGITTTGTGGTTLTGGVTLTAGTNVSLSTTGNTITINGAAGTALTANQGIDIVNDVILLGTTASGANPFLANRFITTNANTLGIVGTPGANQPTVNITATPSGAGAIAIKAENTGSGHGVYAMSAGDATNTSHAGFFVHTGTNAVEQDILKLVRGSNFTSGTGIGFYSANATRNGFVGYNTDGYLAKTGANASLATRHQIYTTGQHRFNNYVGSSSFPITPVYSDYRDGLALVVDRNASAGDQGKVVTMPLVSAYLNSSITTTPTASPAVAGNTSYTKVGNVVTVMVTVQFTYASNPAGTIVTIDLGLPRNSQTNVLIDSNPTSLLHSLSWQSFTSTSIFTGYTASISGSVVRVTLTRAVGVPISNSTHIFTLIYTYVATPPAP